MCLLCIVTGKTKEEIKRECTDTYKKTMLEDPVARVGFMVTEELDFHQQMLLVVKIIGILAIVVEEKETEGKVEEFYRDIISAAKKVQEMLEKVEEITKDTPLALDQCALCLRKFPSDGSDGTPVCPLCIITCDSSEIQKETRKH